jgi:hypothetical protein
MSQWEYRAIDLNDPPRRVDDIGLLNSAGEEGWELVAIRPNNIAYLKRQLEAQAAPPKSSRRKSSSSTNP